MRITSLVQNTQLKSNIQTLQQQIAELQAQISTGKKADRFSGLGTQARASIELRSSRDRLESFRNNIITAERRMETMDTIMRRIGDIANEIRDEVLKARDGSEPNMELLNKLASDRIDEMRRLLNTEQDGRFLFSGIATDTQPVLAPTANLAFVNTELTGYTPANLATRLANIDAQFATVTNYYAGDTGPNMVSTRIDEGLDLDYGVRADNDAFQDIFAGLHIIAELDYDVNEKGTFEDIMDAAASRLKSGFAQLNNEVALLGDKSKTLELTSIRHEETEIVLSSQIGDIEDVDVSEKITQLLQLQTQMETSFNVIGQLRGLSLTKFI